MPFIEGNLVYQPVDAALLLYHRDRELYKAEGIPVLLSQDRPDSQRYSPLNEGETFGVLRVLNADERTSIQDVVIFRDLPNDVHLVQGIITETPQTPLSHVNLRAVQNQNPNAYIENASTHPDIAPLIGKFVRFAVTKEGFEIEEATSEQIDTQFSALRPEDRQFPERDLSIIEIASLEDLGFTSSPSIGVKAANLAELIRSYRGLRIPRETFPSIGYAIPFWFYDQFMIHNGLYKTAETMIKDPAFAADTEVRNTALRAFRKKIRDGKMPAWMKDALTVTQSNFPEGQGIRCRSSTNNEDLPGFNGAGLYAYYTHHPDEGHLSKSVKQVYASLWRSLAFEHREFYKVDHFSVAMGVLLHPNYDEELVNGVAVSKYPLGGIANGWYINAQIGENLVTNPGTSFRPEELLVSVSPAGPSIVRLAASNQVPFGDAVLTDADALRTSEYLQSITRHFKGLYEGDEEFEMEIEFKVTSEGIIAIKQARPWVN